MLNDQLNQFNTSCSNSDWENSRFEFLQINQPVAAVDFELVVNILNILFLEKYDRVLSVVEELLLKGVWQQKTYSEIAKENNYSSDYFSNVAAPKLLKQLSQLIKCRIIKKNCRSIVTKYIVENELLDWRSDEVKKVKTSRRLNTESANRYSLKYNNNLLNSSFLQDAINLVGII